MVDVRFAGFWRGRTLRSQGECTLIFQGGILFFGILNIPESGHSGFLSGFVAAGFERTCRYLFWRSPASSPASTSPILTHQPENVASPLGLLTGFGDVIISSTFRGCCSLFRPIEHTTSPISSITAHEYSSRIAGWSS
jgi:hypothetical protein